MYFNIVQLVPWSVWTFPSSAGIHREQRRRERHACFVVLHWAQGVGIPGAVAQLDGRVGGPSAASMATGAGTTAEGGPSCQLRVPGTHSIISRAGGRGGCPLKCCRGALMLWNTSWNSGIWWLWWLHVWLKQLTNFSLSSSVFFIN